MSPFKSWMDLKLLWAEEKKKAYTLYSLVLWNIVGWESCKMSILTPWRWMQKDKSSSSLLKQFGLHVALLLFSFHFLKSHTTAYFRPRWSLLWHELIACSSRIEQLQTSQGPTCCSDPVTELLLRKDTALCIIAGQKKCRGHYEEI